MKRRIRKNYVWLEKGLRKRGEVMIIPEPVATKRPQILWSNLVKLFRSYLKIKGWHFP
jgi:hypothetical protein